MNKLMEEKLLKVFQSVRQGVLAAPLKEGSFGLPDDCPDCRKEKLMIRWQGDTLAITCHRPPMGCGFRLVESRS